MKNDTDHFVQMLRKQGKRAGDVVHLHGKPHLIYEMSETSVTLFSMDERKLFITLNG